MELKIIDSYGLRKKAIAVEGCRKIKKRDMKWNSYTPQITVDPESYIVKVGQGKEEKVVTVEPAEQVALTRLYNVY